MFKYIKETQQELKHVSWPTRQQAIAYTVLVIIVSIATAYFLGFFDAVFTDVLARFFI